MAPKAPKKGATGRPRCIAILADMHHDDSGNNHAGHWRAVLLWLAELRPDEVVLAGDFGEFSSGSAHTPDFFRAAYEADVKAVRAALKQVRAACPKAAITYLCGNHETATIRALERGAPAFVPGFWERFAQDLDFERLGVEWVPEGRPHQPIKRGNLRVLHGHQVPGRWLPKHHAAKVADLYGGPGLTVVFGHSHRPGLFVKAGMEGNCTAVALGCGRTLEPDWKKGSPDGWENEVAVAYVHPDGAADVVPVRFTNGRMTWAGKVYR